jgi:putative flippase GtrA
MELTVLIPAFNPTGQLLAFAKDLMNEGLEDLIIVDDGSASPEAIDIFDQLSCIPNVTILRNAVHLGKGAALKLGLNHIYNMRRGAGDGGVVTADADGQHLPQDVLSVGRAMKSNSNSLILGVRSFGSNTPLRSRLGNNITKLIFRFLVGRNIKDTQTGLRGIPLSLIPHLLPITLNGYDFELEMLVQAGHYNFEIVQVPIETVYFNGNIHSYFNPLTDSFRIYMVFLRFIGASLIAAIADYLVFMVTFGLSANIGLSQGLARTVGMIINFAMVKKFVFKSRQKVAIVFVKFVLLVIVLGITSYSLIELQVRYLGMGVLQAKLLSELLLYFLNFATQREVVFARSVTE